MRDRQQQAVKGLNMRQLTSTLSTVSSFPEPWPSAGTPAHAGLLSGINDALVERLTSALPDNYLQALRELYTNFHGALLSALLREASLNFSCSALEARVFSLKMPRSFFTLYAPPEHSPQESLERWEDEIGWMSRAVS